MLPEIQVCATVQNSVAPDDYARNEHRQDVIQLWVSDAKIYIFQDKHPPKIPHVWRNVIIRKCLRPEPAATVYNHFPVGNNMF